MPKREGQGLFAAALLQAYPQLPVEEEGRLLDPHLRENFIECVFAERRLHGLFRGAWSHGRVLAFHTAHKHQLMAHSPSAFRSLGRLVAGRKALDRAEFRAQYEAGFMQALRKPATRGRNANVLHHAAAHLKKCLDSAARSELAGLIDEYRRGLVPLVVPITLLAHPRGLLYVFHIV